MEPEFLKIDHVGIAVPDLEAALIEYRQNYGIDPLLKETLVPQQTSLAFLQLPGTTVELLAPLVPDSPVGRFLNSRGPGLHHICYEVVSVEASLDRLKTRGFTLIDTAPRPGARGSRIAFIHPRSCGGVLTELCDYSGNK